MLYFGESSIELLASNFGWSSYEKFSELIRERPHFSVLDDQERKAQASGIALLSERTGIQATINLLKTYGFNYDEYQRRFVPANFQLPNFNAVNTDDKASTIIPSDIPSGVLCGYLFAYACNLSRETIEVSAGADVLPSILENMFRKGKKEPTRIKRDKGGKLYSYSAFAPNATLLLAFKECCTGSTKNMKHSQYHNGTIRTMEPEEIYDIELRGPETQAQFRKFEDDLINNFQIEDYWFYEMETGTNLTVEIAALLRRLCVEKVIRKKEIKGILQAITEQGAILAGCPAICERNYLICAAVNLLAHYLQQNRETLAKAYAKKADSASLSVALAPLISLVEATTAERVMPHHFYDTKEHHLATAFLAFESLLLKMNAPRAFLSFYVSKEWGQPGNISTAPSQLDPFLFNSDVMQWIKTKLATDKQTYYDSHDINRFAADKVENAVDEDPMVEEVDMLHAVAEECFAEDMAEYADKISELILPLLTKHVKEEGNFLVFCDREDEYVQEHIREIESIYTDLENNVDVTDYHRKRRIVKDFIAVHKAVVTAVQVANANLKEEMDATNSHV